MIGIDPIDEWHLKRRGKFTSSCVFKLLTNPEKGRIFSTGAMTYIEERAMESVTKINERPELEQVDSILHGKVHELPAYEEYVRATRNYDIEYWGLDNPKFFEWKEFPQDSGGTPDGGKTDSSGNALALVEIKCPKNSILHFRRLNWKDQFEIKQYYDLVYAQMQHLLMINPLVSECHFVSYDDRFLIKDKRIKIIPVKRDENFINKLELKIVQARFEKYKILSEHLGTTVKCLDDVLKVMAA